MNARELAANVTELTTLPDVYQQIRALADDPHASLKQFADVVSMDAAISARLLRLVNSPFYGLPGKVDSVLRAINLIGTDELCNLVLASSIGGMFKGVSNAALDLPAFWWRNVSVAMLARQLGRQNHMPSHERLFIAGILHDVGRLVAFQQVPTLAAEIERTQTDAYDTGRQRAVLGFGYAELGAELLHQWGMPEALVEIVGCQPQPQRALEYGRDAAVLHIAARAVPLIAADPGTPAELETLVAEDLWEESGLDAIQLDTALAAVRERGSEVRGLF